MEPPLVLLYPVLIYGTCFVHSKYRKRSGVGKSRVTYLWTIIGPLVDIEEGDDTRECKF